MDDVFPSNSRLLWRGATKRCPLCGGRRLFKRWIHFADHCPTCGFTFEREVGFFTGGWMVNLAATEIVLFALLMIYILQVTSGHPNTVAFITVAVVVGIAVPIGFFPFSRTIWSAVELIARKPTHKEVEQAILLSSQPAKWHEYESFD